MCSYHAAMVVSIACASCWMYDVRVRPTLLASCLQGTSAIRIVTVHVEG